MCSNLHFKILIVVLINAMLKKLADTSKEILLQILPHILWNNDTSELAKVHGLCKWEWMLLDGQTSCKHTRGQYMRRQIFVAASWSLTHQELPAWIHIPPQPVIEHYDHPWARGTGNSLQHLQDLSFMVVDSHSAACCWNYSQEAKHLFEHVLR